MERSKYQISVLRNNSELPMGNILLTHALNSIELLNCSLKLIIILKNVIFGLLVVLWHIFSKIRHSFIVNRKLIWKYLEEYSD